MSDIEPRTDHPDEASGGRPRAAQKGRKGLVASVKAFVLLSALWYVTPVLHPAYWKEDAKNEAMEHGIMLSLALQEFDSKFGCFPDASTASSVKETTGSSLIFAATSSNQYLRQLIASGCEGGEISFYAKTASSHRPDNNFADDAHILSPGECGFAYLPGFGSGNDPRTPVLMSPMIPGTTHFDPSIYNGKAVVVFAGDVVLELPIDAEGRAIQNDMDLFDPRQPFWHGEIPDFKWPE